MAARRGVGRRYRPRITPKIAKGLWAISMQYESERIKREDWEGYNPEECIDLAQRWISETLRWYERRGRENDRRARRRATHAGPE